MRRKSTKLAKINPNAAIPVERVGKCCGCGNDVKLYFKGNGYRRRCECGQLNVAPTSFSHTFEPIQETLKKQRIARMIRDTKTAIAARLGRKAIKEAA